MFIAIEGNIGVGKSFLAKTLAKNLRMPYVPEQYQNWMLKEFYSKREDVSFLMQMRFLVDSLAIFKVNKDMVADFSPYRTRAFSSVILNKEQMERYNEMEKIMMPEFKHPDITILLRQGNPYRLLQNIRKRGREMEQDITIDYLQKIEDALDEAVPDNKNVRRIHIKEFPDLEEVKEEVNRMLDWKIFRF
jgi:deoxyguanosine kinase